MPMLELTAVFYTFGLDQWFPTGGAGEDCRGCGQNFVILVRLFVKRKTTENKGFACEMKSILLSRLLLLLFIFNHGISTNKEIPLVYNIIVTKQLGHQLLIRLADN